MTARVVICAPLRAEAARLAPAFPPGAVIHSGPGPRRATRARASAAVRDADAVAVAGIAGGLSEEVAPGDVVVATEVRGPSGITACPGAEILAAALRRRGLRVHTGPVASVAHIVVRQGDRDRLARTGALCVDTESAWLLAGPHTRPVACVRVVADAPPRPVIHPATVRKVRTALGRLPDVADALAEWAAAIRPRAVLTAGHSTFPDPLPAGADLVLILGNPPSPHDLSELTDGAGVPAYRIHGAGDIDLRWLRAARTVLVTANPSAPPGPVAMVINALRGLGPVKAPAGIEDVHRTLPKEVGAP